MEFIMKPKLFVVVRVILSYMLREHKYRLIPKGQHSKNHINTLIVI